MAVNLKWRSLTPKERTKCAHPCESLHIHVCSAFFFSSTLFSINLSLSLLLPHVEPLVEGFNFLCNKKKPRSHFASKIKVQFRLNIELCV